MSTGPATPSAGPPDRGGARETASIPTAYASLLTQLSTETIDPDYEVVAAARAAAGDDAERSPHHHRPVALVLTLAAFGALIAVSALHTEQDAPAAAAERAELVDQIHSGQARLDDLHGNLTALQEEVTSLQATLASDVNGDRALTQQLSDLGASAGVVAVTGPGVQITVDDAPAGAGSGGIIRDTDLQTLVNALWQAGAEAIAIDGHRLTSLTSIRYAGSAITVDYRSLAPPYVIEATGNPDTLPARLLDTPGGQTWLGLRENFGIRFDTVVRDKMTLPGDAHDHLNYARPVGEGS